MPSTPYMKLYIGDYLGDTSHLTTLQHGAYLLLIMAYWQRGGCVRNADAMLRQCTRTTDAEWQECRETVLEFFEECDGFLYHRRIDKELQKRVSVSNKSKAAADTRWSVRNASALRTQCVRNADAMPLPESIDPEEYKKEKSTHDAYAMRTHNGRNADENQQAPLKASSRTRFRKPSPEEVDAYAAENRYAVDGRKFCDYYDSTGWKVGAHAMADWQAAVRTWNGKARPEEREAIEARRREEVPMPVCPICGRQISDGICPNGLCPQYEEGYVEQHAEA